MDVETIRQLVDVFGVPAVLLLLVVWLACRTHPRVSIEVDPTDEQPKPKSRR